METSVDAVRLYQVGVLQLLTQRLKPSLIVIQQARHFFVELCLGLAFLLWCAIVILTHQIGYFVIQSRHLFIEGIGLLRIFLLLHVQ